MVVLSPSYRVGLYVVQCSAQNNSNCMIGVIGGSLTTGNCYLFRGVFCSVCILRQVDKFHGVIAR